MNKLTIIIPVYNCELYIARCLEALVVQTNKEFEVIVIDDGSSDNTYRKCLEYKRKLNLKIEKNDKPNGPMLARMKGVKLAETEWVSFVDADDWVEECYTEKLIKEVENQNVDVLLFDYNIVKKDGAKNPSKWYKEINNCGAKGSIIAHCEMSLCLLVAKRGLFAEFQAEKIHHGEDALVVHYLFAKCGKIGLIKDALYNYFWHVDSLSTNVGRSAYKDLIVSFYAIQKIYGDEYKQEVCFMGIKNLVYGAILNLYKSDETDKKRRMNKILNDFTEMYPNWERNIYIKSLPRNKRFFIYCCLKRYDGYVLLFTKLHSWLLKVLCS